MVKFRYTFLLLFIGLIATNNWCVIGSITIYSNGPKQVCLIGEYHNGCYRPEAPCAAVEMRDSLHLLGLAHAAAASMQPVTFCLEESAHHLAYMNRQIKVYPFLQRSQTQLLANFAQQFNYTTGNVHFVLADNRGPAFCFWAENMLKWTINFARKMPPILIDALSQLPPSSHQIPFPIEYTPENVDSLLRNNPDLLGIFFSPSGLFNQCFSKENQMELLNHIYTVGEFLGKINNFIATIESENLSKLDDDPLFQFIRPRILLVREAVKDAREFFKRATGNDPQMLEKSVVDCIHDAIVNQLFYSLSAEEKKWGENLMRVVDIAFARTIEKVLSKNNIVIMVCGQTHCENLQQFFKLKKFQKIYDKHQQIEVKDGHYLSLRPDEIMKQYFSEIKSRLGFK